MENEIEKTKNYFWKGGKKSSPNFTGEEKVFLGDYIKRKRRWSFFWGALVTALILSLIFSASEITNQYPAKHDHIAQISIDGGIFEDEYRDDMLKEMADRDDIRAVILRVNSPGGAVYPSERIYKNIKKLSEDVPVVTVMEDYAASGGYIVSLAADYIIAGETTVTGSVGVISETPNISDALDKLGIETTLTRSSEAKGGISPLRDPTDEELADEQALINGLYQWFRGLVGERRGLSGNALNAVTQGTVYTGIQALELGLIDEIGDQDEALAYLENKDMALKDLDVVDWSPLYPEYSPEAYMGATAKQAVEQVSRVLQMAKQTQFMAIMK